MRQFSSTDLGNRTGDVLAAASQEPVEIARHGKVRFVVLTTETFQKLRSGRDSRVSRWTADMPEEEAEMLLSALSQMSDEDE